MLWHGKSENTDETAVFAVRIADTQEFEDAEVFWSIKSSAGNEKENFMLDLSGNGKGWNKINDALRYALETAVEHRKQGSTLGVRDTSNAGMSKLKPRKLRDWWARSNVRQRVGNLLALAGAATYGSIPLATNHYNEFLQPSLPGVAAVSALVIGLLMWRDGGRQNWEGGTGTERSPVFEEMVTKPAISPSEAEDSLAETLVAGKKDVPLPPGV